jgi:hypothetical protein
MSTVEQTRSRCPQLHVDPTAEPPRKVVLTDDFGGEIRMSTEQLRTLAAQVRRGIFDTSGE